MLDQCSAPSQTTSRHIACCWPPHGYYRCLTSPSNFGGSLVLWIFMDLELGQFSHFFVKLWKNAVLLHIGITVRIAEEHRAPPHFRPQQWTLFLAQPCSNFSTHDKIPTRAHTVLCKWQVTAEKQHLKPFLSPPHEHMLVVCRILKEKPNLFHCNYHQKPSDGHCRMQE